MRPFEGELIQAPLTGRAGRALLPAPPDIELAPALRWAPERELRLIAELDQALEHDYGAAPLGGLDRYRLAVLELAAPCARAMMRDGLILLTSGFVDLLRFMSAHVHLQRRFTLARRAWGEAALTAEQSQAEILNNEIPMYYTAISSAFAEGRVEGGTFHQFVSALPRPEARRDAFRMQRGWLGFALLHEAGHYQWAARTGTEPPGAAPDERREEFFCDRFALGQMARPIAGAGRDAPERYRKFIGFIGAVLVFFTNRWLSDYAAAGNGTHPATFERTAHLIDVVNADGQWSELRQNLAGHWRSVETVAAMEAERKAATSAGLRRSIAEKLVYYASCYTYIALVLELHDRGG